MKFSIFQLLGFFMLVGNMLTLNSLLSLCVVPW